MDGDVEDSISMMEYGVCCQFFAELANSTVQYGNWHVMAEETERDREKRCDGGCGAVVMKRRIHNTIVLVYSSSVQLSPLVF